MTTNRLKSLRKSAGLTQLDLAKATGLDARRISVAERANPDRISLGTALPVARALGIEPRDLVA